MTENNAASGSNEGKGTKFFDRADEVASTGNWDFAIEMYLEGIAREPENVERGHRPLREVAMRRKAQGGKNPGLMDQLKRKGGRDPVTALVNGEYLLAKEPGSVQYMIQVLTAARKLNVGPVVKWIADILLEAMRQGKPNLRVLTTLIEAYNDIEEYGPAVRACEMAIQLSPNNEQLQDAQRELSAKYTIKKGRYDQEGDFVKGVKNLDKQKELMQKDSMVQSKDFLTTQAERAREEYLANPTVPGKINAVVDALLKFEDEGYEAEAIGILQKAFTETKAYQYKMRMGDIRVRQLKRRYNQLMSAGRKDDATQAARDLLAFELEEYAERSANYPTDLGIKYELGRRQFVAEKFDEAISSFQMAQRDPRRHVQALNFLGLAFARKGLYQESADTFRRALEADMTDEVAKQLRYNLGDVLERMHKLDTAGEQFSIVAQIDYNYKDVRQRLENLRRKSEENTGSA